MDDNAVQHFIPRLSAAFLFDCLLLFLTQQVIVFLMPRYYNSTFGIKAGDNNEGLREVIAKAGLTVYSLRKLIRRDKELRDRRAAGEGGLEDDDNNNRRLLGAGGVDVTATFSSVSGLTLKQKQKLERVAALFKSLQVECKRIWPNLDVSASSNTSSPLLPSSPAASSPSTPSISATATLEDSTSALLVELNDLAKSTPELAEDDLRLLNDYEIGAVIKRLSAISKTLQFIIKNYSPSIVSSSFDIPPAPAEVSNRSSATSQIINTQVLNTPA